MSDGMRLSPEVMYGARASGVVVAVKNELKEHVGNVRDGLLTSNGVSEELHTIEMYEGMLGHTRAILRIDYTKSAIIQMSKSLVLAIEGKKHR